jgi:hypothetical protein
MAFKFDPIYGNASSPHRDDIENRGWINVILLPAGDITSMHHRINRLIKMLRRYYELSEVVESLRKREAISPTSLLPEYTVHLHISALYCDWQGLRPPMLPKIKRTMWNVTLLTDAYLFHTNIAHQTSRSRRFAGSSVLQFGSEARPMPVAQPRVAVYPLTTSPQTIRARITKSSTCDLLENAILDHPPVASERRDLHVRCFISS